jgi:hypothetical protein
MRSARFHLGSAGARWVAGGGRGGESGHASLLLLGVVAALLAGLLVLFAFGQALGATGRRQRAADLAAISAAQVMRDNYPRPSEPPLLPNGLPNPRHLSTGAYLELTRRAARRGASRNGLGPGRVAFPGVGFAPTRVTLRLSREPPVRVSADEPPRRIDVAARATAEVSPEVGGFGMPAEPSGGGTTDRSRTRRASRCAPTWRSPSTAWPPPRAARPALT